MSRDDNLVSTEWLAAHLDAPDVTVIDGSWYLPAMNRDAAAEYAEGHIPGAIHFDIDAIADPDSDLPHMLPRPEMFASRMRKMGIGDGQRIIVYDGMGMFSAPRVWWTFKVMGHDDVAVLDGGLPKWIAEGRPLDDDLPKPRERHFTARKQAGLVRDRDDMRRMMESGGVIVDVRPAGRFSGEEAEPRVGLRSGHIPGSANLPYATLLADGRLKSDAELAAAFEAAGIDPRKPMATSCGSGVSASIASLAVAVLTGRPAAVYDGSWTEWGGDKELPVETGPASRP